MAITKEVVLDKIEIVFVEAEDGTRYPHTQARGKIEIREDGRKIADAGTFRFGAKGPDKDMGDQPDPSHNGEKIPLSDGIKNELRAAQNAHVTQKMVDDFKALKQNMEKELK